MAIFDGLKSWKYDSIRSSIGEDVESESTQNWNPQLDSEKPCHDSHKANSLRLIAPWLASTIFFALLAAYLGFQNVKQSQRPLPGTFRTDFNDARASVQYEERVFTGALKYDPAVGHAYREIDPQQPQYFGESSPEIKAAWDDLIHDEFPTMSESEAAPFTPELKPLPNDGEYHFELAVFHSLHCLNAVRMRLDEYYASTREASADRTGWERVHMDHCLDQLRQSIQCHGDLSPVPLYWWQGFPIAFGISHEHTCRKWEPIREWVDRRNEKGNS